jgi:probable phosphoglycerate mutase
MTEVPSAPAEVRQLRFERPPGATSILLVRHGETVPARADSPFTLVGGHGDPELDPRGHEQAERVAARLCKPRFGETLSALYVTNLQRTAQTAAPLAKLLDMEPRVEADLREVFLGEWEGGLYRIKVLEGGPIVKRLFEEGRWDVIPGAEPDEAFIARIRAGITRIAAAHPDQVVAAFTHGGVIGRVMTEATGSRSLAFSGSSGPSTTPPTSRISERPLWGRVPSVEVQIRPVRSGEYEQAGSVVIAAYEALPGGHMTAEYAAELGDVARRAAGAEVLVAVDDEDGFLLGCVTFVPDSSSPWAELVEEGEAAIRMLGVAPTAQGRGVGLALVDACLERARQLKRHAVLLHTTPWMPAAQRLYGKAGFVRVPERDWYPTPAVPLLAYRLPLD